MMRFGSFLMLMVGVVICTHYIKSDRDFALAIWSANVALSTVVLLQKD